MSPNWIATVPALPSTRAGRPLGATLTGVAAFLVVALMMGLPLASAHDDEDKSEDDACPNCESSDADTSDLPAYLPPPQHIEMPLDEVQVELILDVLDDMQPWGTDRLRKWREERPERFNSIMQSIAPQALRDAWLREHDPPAFELRRREHILGQRAIHVGHEARRTEGAEKKAELREKLEGILSEQFEVRVALIEHEMSHLEGRLQHLRRQLESQKMQRENFIEQWLSRILEDGPSRRGGPARGDTPAQPEDDADTDAEDEVAEADG